MTPSNSLTGPFQLRILVAEDSPLHQRLTTRVLHTLGCLVTVAQNGYEAVEVFEQQEFDLVFMDIEMPEMDGIQATAAIRGIESDTGKHTPVVALTSTGDRQQCLAAGMDGHIIKPLTIGVLNQEIARLDILGPLTTMRNWQRPKKSRSVGTVSPSTPPP